MVDIESTIFPIVQIKDGHGWKDVLERTSSHLDDKGITRLQMALGSIKTIVIEHHYIDKDYRNTFSHFHSKRFVTPDSRCIRLHFFNKFINRDDLIQPNKKKLDDSYLGYSVIRPTRPNCIGRTFLSIRCRKNLGYMTVCEEDVKLHGIELKITGFPFISQDVDATVCAESSIWMLQRYYSNKYKRYRESYPFEITKLKERHAFGSRIYPAAGLSVIQIAEDLRLNDFSPLIYYRKNTPKNFEHYLYTYIESGFPLIVTFEDHAIIAIGHQADFSNISQKSLFGGKKNNIRYTSEFNSALIVNNDNEFPYQVLKRQKGKDLNQIDSKYDFKQIQSFIVPLAEKIFLAAEDFNDVVITLLKGGKFGYGEHSKLLKKEKLVLRLFLTTGQSYKTQLIDRALDNNIVKSIYRELPLPHFIWVCEISTVAEIENERILGEIIWDATRNAYELGGFISIHYPEVLFVDIGSTLNENVNIKKYELKHNSKTQSYQLYKNNLKEV